MNNSVYDEVLYCTLSNGIKLYTTLMTENLERYAISKNLKNIRCFLSVRNEERTYILVYGQNVIYESRRAEETGAHIDMIAVSSKVK